MKEKKHNSKIWNERCYKWILFLCIFVCSIIIAKILNVTYYWFDADWYWTFGDPIFEDGFHILRFSKVFRGYFHIILLGIFKKIFPGFWGWYVLSAGSMAACFSLSLPYVIHGKAISTKTSAFRSFLAYAVFMFFWCHFMQYPLSDFMAAFYFISAAALVRYLMKEHRTLTKVTAGFCAGLFLYAAYNTRVVYLYGSLILVFVLWFSSRKNFRNILITTVSVAAGWVLLSFPQVIINRYNEGSLSPFVNTKIYTDQNLEFVQIFWGLEMVRAEAYVGESDQYPYSQVIYTDPVSEQIIEEHNLTPDTFTMEEYLKVLFRHPFDFLGIYLRHLISLMTPGFSLYPYNTILYEDISFNVIVSILIWLTAACGITEQMNRSVRHIEVFIIFAICLPSLMEVVGAPELRFFMPVYLLAYYYVFEAINYKELAHALKPRWLQTAVCLIAVFCLWISLFGEIIVHNEKNRFLINGHAPYSEQTINVNDTEE